jgi:hypothetical protein
MYPFKNCTVVEVTEGMYKGLYKWEINDDPDGYQASFEKVFYGVDAPIFAAIPGCETVRRLMTHEDGWSMTGGNVFLFLFGLPMYQVSDIDFFKVNIQNSFGVHLNDYEDILLSLLRSRSDLHLAPNDRTPLQVMGNVESEVYSRILFRYMYFPHPLECQMVSLVNEQDRLKPVAGFLSSFDFQSCAFVLDGRGTLYTYNKQWLQGIHDGRLMSMYGVDVANASPTLTPRDRVFERNSKWSALVERASIAVQGYFGFRGEA